ncbi:cyclophane-forming radical SAM/SPASM peptide maturase YhhB [Burkholderia gladioli]|uniref:cyclophane-forming radical SAM/SPASM peptide maturase YhhB n=1 Tax=Burkholderia gladioli TaxID=28095 RepID=UPI001640EB97|nr:cyclophane-forming radical SAM/SPASM peptide maturase YhhB [Burkholderia gladioli]
MNAVLGEAKLTSFLLKVASRCNLDCDYCYMYHHADQSWRSMPPILSHEHRNAFALQLSAYVKHANLRRCVAVFHGGEPLLMGAAELAAFAQQLRTAVGGDVQLDVSLQTNGLLLTSDSLEMLRHADVGVSLSLDGPKEVNDLHRTTRKGRSSYARTLGALELLKTVPDTFTGVISVIDPRVPPRNLLEFFDHHAVPRLDFLLPDAHHLRQPPGRHEQPDLYERWLIEAFDVWFDEYPHLEVRTFEALLDGVAGLPSQTDAFGFGDVSLITIETDGTYHDLDVLKVVGQGATKIGGGVKDTSIAQVAQSPSIAAHRLLLRKDGLCESCRECEVVEVCGGGAVPHRYGLRGFQNPTVYCREMRALIKHVRSRVIGALSKGPIPAGAANARGNGSLANFECAETSSGDTAELWANAIASQVDDLKRALMLFASTDCGPASAAADQLLRSPDLDVVAQQPGAIAWSRTMLALADGRLIHAVDGTPLNRDADYVHWMLINLKAFTEERLQLHLPDRWLRLPFGNSISFENDDVAEKAVPVLREALAIIEAWRPALSQELKAICRAVQFVRDPCAEPDKIVSFSDNTVPGALFVSVIQGDRLIDAYDLADSLIHEYRHQKLYLLERLRPIVEPTSMKVTSPWREDLRPPSGLFHAIFVFVELRRFWMYVRGLNIEHLNRRADVQLLDTNARLDAAFHTLATCRLTESGHLLAGTLQAGAKE